MKNKIQFKVCNQGDNAKAYKECKRFIKKFQKIMRLQDWDIDLGFMSGEDIAKEMGNSNYEGYCSRTLELKSAYIGINIESTRINKSIEETLIHEMCHIVDYGLQCYIAKDDDKFYDGLHEQMIENYAKAIWNAYKK